MANKFKVDLVDAFPNWSNDAGAWASSSGGLGIVVHPTSADAVTFDANSGDCSIDVNSNCASLVCTAGYAAFIDGTATLTVNVATGISGKFTLIAGCWLATSPVVFAPLAAARQVTTAANQLYSVELASGNSTFGLTFQDSLSVTTSLTLTKGILNFNLGFTHYCASFVSSNATLRTLNLTNATMTLTGTGTVWNTSTATNLTLTPTNSTIVISDGSTQNTFAGGGLTFAALTTGGKGTTFSGDNTFTTLTANGLIVLTGTTTTATSVVLTGCTAITGGMLSVASGTVTAPSGCTLTNSTATGGATFVATAATDGGGNSGWGTIGAAAPVADFTGAPLSGSTSLSVVFTDASTNTPTSWLWEKNSGSGWVNFAGSPTVQNPTESFATGTWSVRVTATNATGSDTKTRTNYVTATSSSSHPSAAVTNVSTTGS